jgi:hypothetical protein
MNEYREHYCTEKCKCPIHEIDFLYSKRERLHACQRIDCEFAHGFENHRWADPNHDVLGDIKDHLNMEKSKLWKTGR